MPHGQQATPHRHQASRYTIQETNARASARAACVVRALAHNKTKKMQKKETIEPTAQELHQAGEIKHEITTGTRHNGAWSVETILPGDRLQFSTMKRGREISCVLRVIDSVKRSPGVTVVDWQYGNPSEVMARREARATKAAVQGVHREGLHAWVIRCQELNKAAEARRWHEVQKRHAVA